MAEDQIDVEKLAELTGTEKSAILMMLLGEEEAAQVLQNCCLVKFSTLVLLCTRLLELIKPP